MRPVRAWKQRHGGSGPGGGVDRDRLRWKRLRDPVTVVGDLGAVDREACWDLGATTAASLAM